MRRILPTLLLLLVCAGALRIRYQDPYDLVLTETEVVLRSNDPWYHMRLVDNLLHSFPHRLTFDPYALYPQGQDVGYAPLLDLIVVGSARLLGLQPDGYSLMYLAAILPPIFGVMILWTIFLIGNALFDETTGLLAAAIAAFAPGQFLMISLVGFFDHHVLEVLLSTLVVLLCIRALQKDSSKYAIAAGIALGLYLLAWQGGVVFVAILLVWFALSPSRLLKLAIAMFPAALAILLPFTPWGGVVQRPAIAVLVAGIAVIAMGRIARWYTTLLFPLIALAVISTGLFHAAASHVSLLDYFHQGPSVWEIRPLLFATGRFSISPALEEFGPAAWLVLPALALVAWQWWRNARPAALGLFLVTSLGWLAGTLMMRRFAYYFLGYAALLAARLCLEGARRVGDWAQPVVAILAAILLVAPNLAPAFRAGQPDLSRLTGAASAGPSADWRDALEWMRRNTPEPLGSPDANYQVFDARTFQYPPSAYGVMVWGNQGFWVTRIAHRIPVDNPTWIGSRDVASFYVESDPAVAARLLDRKGVRYVIAPIGVPLLAGPGDETAAGEYAVMASWIGRARASFAEQYVFPERPDRNGNVRPKLLYYPAYFQSMAPRLCLFGGRATPAQRVAVVEFRKEGTRNIVTRYREFTSYAEAEQAQAAAPGSRIVSDDPLKPCVPLAALDRFRMVYHSPSHALLNHDDVYVVNIYEYR